MMNRNWGEFRFETRLLDSKDEGWVAVDLFRTSREKADWIARVCFWDASGEFTLETFASNAPLVIIEDLINEAKEIIRVA